MKTEYKHMRFEQEARPLLHEVEWYCVNKRTKLPMGRVYHHDEWNRWVVSFEDAWEFDSGCLRDIAQFLDTL